MKAETEEEEVDLMAEIAMVVEVLAETGAADLIEVVQGALADQEEILELPTEDLPAGLIFQPVGS